MNYRFFEHVRKAGFGICLTMVCGGFVACTDEYDLDDKGNYPPEMGSSIYETLKNPQSVRKEGKEALTGSFTYYVRLIDDLGYAETLGRTGSKTVFPANDEAFKRFFENNAWNVADYDQLTLPMKKQLLFGSMLDNALLVEMFSNISNGSTAVSQGQALKHATNDDVINSMLFITGKENFPANNKHWEKYYDSGINLVNDASQLMMVHFTEEQMTANNITTTGENSDFEVITGSKYDAAEHSAYIFRNKIINSDITCKNGYIHQLENVLLPPGNMAEVIRTNGESRYFSRMLDRFSAPFYDADLTKRYNDYAQTNNLPQIERIYEKRYFSSRSHGGELLEDPNGIDVTDVLPFDPGWNDYNNGTGENSAKDIATMFVPTDKAMEDYFLKGEGAFLIDAFGQKQDGQVLNDLAHLEANIDSIPLKNIQQLVENLMQSSFVNYVPSKFGNVMDKAHDPMGLTIDHINKNDDGTCDVKIANNGVIYMLNTMFAPPTLTAVSAPITLSDNMKVMDYAVHDGKTSDYLGLKLNYYAYLLAMSANYAFFIPTDEAFKLYYVDPTYLKEDQPRVLKFYYQAKSPYVFCSAWEYDPTTGLVGDSIGTVSASSFRTQLTDILEYHTVVLPSGAKLGDNNKRYYKTKHGGAIYFNGSEVKSGAQITNNLPTSDIQKVYNQKNGQAFAINHLIQAPQQSVLDVLQKDQFSEFRLLCTDMEMDNIMAFASDKLNETNKVTGKKRMDAYHTFAAKNGLTDNVNYFNSYNYTVYAPDNEAMNQAYNNGLPRWSDIKVLYDQYNDRLQEEKLNNKISEEVQAARDKALAMVEEINTFIRYHFQDNSIYADNVVEGGSYPTACSDTLGIREKLQVSGSNGKLTVKDKRKQLTIDADGSKLVNEMTRDYVLNKTAHAINTSSFAVVHQISQPLTTHSDTDRYDGMWTGKNAARRMAAYRKLFEQKLYKRY